MNLVFRLTQHSRDEQLLKSLINYLNCGRLDKRPGKDAVCFIIIKLKDILNKIIT